MDFYTASRLEPKLARPEKQTLSRILHVLTLFEGRIKTIFTTNPLWFAARNMARTLVDVFDISLNAFGSQLLRSARDGRLRTYQTSPLVIEDHPKKICG